MFAVNFPAPRGTGGFDAVAWPTRRDREQRHPAVTADVPPTGVTLGVGRKRRDTPTARAGHAITHHVENVTPRIPTRGLSKIGTRGISSRRATHADTTRRRISRSADPTILRRGPLRERSRK